MEGIPPVLGEDNWKVVGSIIVHAGSHDCHMILGEDNCVPLRGGVYYCHYRCMVT